MTNVMASSSITPKSIGDRIRPGTYKLHSTFKKATNFTHQGELVAIVDESVGAGPLNIVVNRLQGIESLTVTKQAVLINHISFNLSDLPIYNSSITAEAINTKNFERNILFFEKLLLETSHIKGLAFLLDKKRESYFKGGFETAFVKQITEGTDALFGNNLIAGVKKIRGCGFGLTPSGDDFISGLLIALNVIQQAYNTDLNSTINDIYLAAKGGNIFSNTFLSSSKDGCVIEKVKKVLESLINDDQEEIRKRGKALFAIGESSGTDLAVGFLMGIQHKGLFYDN